MTTTPDTPLPVEASELLPCPFCGGAAKMIHPAGWPCVECSKCGAHGDPGAAEFNDHPYVADRKAAEAWNTRLQPTPSAEVGQGGEVERRDGLDDGDDDDLEGWLNDRD